MPKSRPGAKNIVVRRKISPDPALSSWQMFMCLDTPDIGFGLVAGGVAKRRFL